MEKKLFELMVQAEDLQKHAVELQNKAQETFLALPIAVEQAGQKIRSTGLQMALILFGLGILVCGASVGFFIWSTDSLREERNALKVAIQAEETTLATLRSQTWGVRLHEGEKGRFIVLPEGMSTEANWTVGKNAAIRLVKK